MSKHRHLAEAEIEGVTHATAFAISLIVSLVSPLLWLPVLRRLGLLDIPNDRSSHTAPAIRGAGLAPATGVLVAGVLALTFVPDSTIAAVVFLAALAAAAVGFAEDLRGLSVGLRIGAQLLVGAGLGTALCVLSDRSLWLVPVISMAVAAYINAANFMDGVDGISALHGLVTGAHFALVGALADQPWLELGGVVVAAVFLGFAPWNLSGRRVFLGDVGSYLLGCLVVGMGAGAFLTGSSLLLAVAPGWPYLADTFFTFATRVRRKEKISEAHRSHVYQQLSVLGLGHIGAAVTVGALSLMCSALAFFAQLGTWQTVVAVLGTALLLGAYLMAPSLRAPGRRAKAL